MSDVKVISGWVPMSIRALDDAPRVHEGIAVMLAKSGPPKGTRYRHVWDAGYYQALEDVRSGALVFKDGRFDTGPNWMKRFPGGGFDAGE